MSSVQSYVAQLNNAHQKVSRTCDLLGAIEAPHYDLHFSRSGYACTVTVAQVVAQSSGNFPTKQAAKENAAKNYLEMMELVCEGPKIYSWRPRGVQTPDGGMMIPLYDASSCDGEAAVSDFAGDAAVLSTRLPTSAMLEFAPVPHYPGALLTLSDVDWNRTKNPAAAVKEGVDAYDVLLTKRLGPRPGGHTNVDFSYSCVGGAGGEQFYSATLTLSTTYGTVRIVDKATNGIGTVPGKKAARDRVARIFLDVIANPPQSGGDENKELSQCLAAAVVADNAESSASGKGKERCEAPRGDDIPHPDEEKDMLDALNRKLAELSWAFIRLVYIFAKGYGFAWFIARPVKFAWRHPCHTLVLLGAMLWAVPQLYVCVKSAQPQLEPQERPDTINIVLPPSETRGPSTMLVPNITVTNEWLVVPNITVEVQLNHTSVDVSLPVDDGLLGRAVNSLPSWATGIWAQYAGWACLFCIFVYICQWLWGAIWVCLTAIYTIVVCPVHLGMTFARWHWRKAYFDAHCVQTLCVWANKTNPAMSETFAQYQLSQVKKGCISYTCEEDHQYCQLCDRIAYMTVHGSRPYTFWQKIALWWRSRVCQYKHNCPFIMDKYEVPTHCLSRVYHYAKDYPRAPESGVITSQKIQMNRMIPIPPIDTPEAKEKGKREQFFNDPGIGDDSNYYIDPTGCSVHTSHTSSTSNNPKMAGGRGSAARYADTPSSSNYANAYFGGMHARVAPPAATGQSGAHPKRVKKVARVFDEHWFDQINDWSSTGYARYVEEVEEWARNAHISRSANDRSSLMSSLWLYRNVLATPIPNILQQMRPEMDAALQQNGHPPLTQYEIDTMVIPRMRNTVNRLIENALAGYNAPNESTPCFVMEGLYEHIMPTPTVFELEAVQLILNEARPIGRKKVYRHSAALVRPESTLYGDDERIVMMDQAQIVTELARTIEQRKRALAQRIVDEAKPATSTTNEAKGDGGLLGKAREPTKLAAPSVGCTEETAESSVKATVQQPMESPNTQLGRGKKKSVRVASPSPTPPPVEASAVDVCSLIEVQNKQIERLSQLVMQSTQQRNTELATTVVEAIAKLSRLVESHDQALKGKDPVIAESAVMGSVPTPTSSAVLVSFESDGHTHHYQGVALRGVGQSLRVMTARHKVVNGMTFDNTQGVGVEITLQFSPQLGLNPLKTKITHVHTTSVDEVWYAVEAPGLAKKLPALTISGAKPAMGDVVTMVWYSHVDGKVQSQNVISGKVVINTNQECVAYNISTDCGHCRAPLFDQNGRLVLGHYNGKDRYTGYPAGSVVVSPPQNMKDWKNHIDFDVTYYRTSANSLQAGPSLGFVDPVLQFPVDFGVDDEAEAPREIGWSPGGFVEQRKTWKLRVDRPLDGIGVAYTMMKPSTQMNKDEVMNFETVGKPNGGSLNMTFAHRVALEYDADLRRPFMEPTYEDFLDITLAIGGLKKKAGPFYTGTHPEYLAQRGDGDFELGASRVAGDVQDLYTYLKGGDSTAPPPNVERLLEQSEYWSVLGKKDGYKPKKMNIGRTIQCPIFELKVLYLAMFIDLEEDWIGRMSEGLSAWVYNGFDFDMPVSDARVLKYNKAFGALACDNTAWDRKIPPSFIEAFYSHLAYLRPGVSNNLLRFLAETTIHSKLVMTDGLIVQKDCGNPSGFMSTLHLNCYVMLMCWLAVIMRRDPEVCCGKNPWKTAENIQKNYHIEICGDDSRVWTLSSRSHQKVTEGDSPTKVVEMWNNELNWVVKVEGLAQFDLSLPLADRFLKTPPPPMVSRQLIPYGWGGMTNLFEPIVNHSRTIRRLVHYEDRTPEQESELTAAAAVCNAFALHLLDGGRYRSASLEQFRDAFLSLDPLAVRYYHTRSANITATLTNRTPVEVLCALG